MINVKKPNNSFAEYGPQVVPVLASVAAGVATRVLAEHSWERAFQSAPPNNPAAPEVSWKEALLWGATLGLVVGLTRVAARRGAVHAWDQGAKRCLID